ncbi:hypothetical protein [Nocardia sp. NPDC049149]|uniref:hypothetical protein n=1 Tax=Nocardia sp. NPDC049149 TaxID=3364315 RepID=UPI003716876D
MVTADDVRRIAMSLPRTTEALVRDRVKYRIGRIVYLALSADETRMGFAFPKTERVALVEAEPDKFMMPRPSRERAQRASHVTARIAHTGAERQRGAGMSGTTGSGCGWPPSTRRN